MPGTDLTISGEQRDALLIAATALGVLYGTETISALAFSFAVLGGLLVFVPWAVFHLDVRGSCRTPHL
jgi:hypothetical protein